MHEITLNGETRRDRLSPERWGELLDLFQRGEGPSRRIVTAVRFDGVAVPTFREPAALERGLCDIGSIEVETSFDQLLRESAQAAFESVAPLQRAVGRIAASLCGHAQKTARRDLATLIAALKGLTMVTEMLTTARGIAGSSGRPGVLRGGHDHQR